MSRFLQVPSLLFLISLFTASLFTVSGQTKASCEIAGLDSVYCNTDPVDTVFGVEPGGKEIILDGTTIGTGWAIINPATLTIGIHTIQYHICFFNFEVKLPPVATLLPQPSVCENEAPFFLTGGSPAGGIYTVDAIIDVITFDPAVFGPGNHVVSYSTGVGGCVGVSPPQILTVYPMPNVTFDPIPQICIDASPRALTEGLPAGGFYTGPGVIGSNFYPSVAGIGVHTLKYTYNTGLCQDDTTQLITVNALPIVVFYGLDLVYCDIDPPVALTGNPTNANGVFTGPGVTDFNDGTGFFNPATAGLGIHFVTYTYTDPATGCVNFQTRQVRVGTLLTFTGLDPQYCEDETNITFTYDPVGGTFDPVAGLTDNGDGTAVFDPSFAGPGNYLITYRYNDIWGCVNDYTQPVVVDALPTVAFVGLDPTYCKNAGTDIVTGNHPGSGVFTGPGITDNGNGTAVIDPASLSVGGPYNVSYAYVDPVSGCSDIFTQSTSVLSLPSGAISGNAIICIGGSTDLTVTFTGTGPFDFTYTDGVNPVTITGAGNPHNFPVSPTVNSTYTLVSVTQANGCSETGTGSATVNLNPLVIITTNPVGKVVCPGDNNTFTVTASGVGLGYQWQKDGVNIAGETNPVLPVNNIIAADAGIYTCLVTSTCGGPLTSLGAVLTVLPSTVINSHPTNKVVCETGSVNFTVVASGSNLTYQWNKDGIPLADGGRISGATSSNMNVTGLILGDAGSYTCTVNGDCGVLTSNPATLLVNENILVTGQPTGVSVCPDDDVTYGVTATGTGLAYQWQKDGVDIPGETNSSLILISVTLADAGVYQCVITGACGVTSSNTAIMVVYDDVTISINPAASIQKCEGGTASFAISASGSSISFQWKKDGVNLVNGGRISGVNTNNLVITPLITGDGGVYTCTVAGTCGSITSSPSTLIVDNDITITIQPTSHFVCDGGNTSFSITANGSNLLYQWQLSGLDLAGETSSVFVLNSVSAADAGGYTCQVSNICGTVSSTIANLAVLDSTKIASHPVSSTLCEDNNVNFTVVATGSNLTYQWQKNGVDLVNGGAISGANSSTVTITSLTPADAAAYNCIVTGSCGIVNSSPALLTIHEKISITSQPTDQYACPGDNIVFSVAVNGSYLNYQWQKNGVNIAGGTNNALVLNSVDATDVANYFCLIYNACGLVPTNIVSLTLYDQTTITLQPVDITSCEGDNISLITMATGSNLTYQWKKNGVALVNGGTISGATSNNLLISSVVTGDEGFYTCDISGSCGSLTSDPSSVVVNKNIVISSQPQNKAACPGTNVTFSVTATGTSLTYQWQRNGVNIVGETSSSLLLSSVDATDAGTYKCVITGACGIVVSNTANLTVYEDVAILVHPSNQLLCQGSSVDFTVIATGSNLTYQWRKNGVDMVNGGTVSGVNTNNLNISSLVLADAGAYTCVVTGSCGTVTSNAGLLIVDESITITNQPVDKDACTGDNIVFSVTASGSNLLYQWKKNGIDLVGENSNSLVLLSVDVTDAGTYYCIITNSCGPVSTNIVNLNMDNATAITTHPVNDTRCEGENTSFTIIATGDNLIYQWKKNGTNLVNGGSISGATSNNLLITGLALADGGIYICEVTGSCGVILSDPANLVVNQNIVISYHPQNKTVCPGNNISFNVTATGTNLSYQWQKDGGNIAGEINSSLVINSVVVGDAGTYRVLVTGDCGVVSTNSATLTVNESITITGQPADQQYCEGTNATFQVSATGSNLTYQWRLNGVDLVDGSNISGATTNTLGVDNIGPADGGAYTCRVTGSCGFVNSNPANLVVDLATSIVTQPVDFVAVDGGNASFSVTAVGVILNYQWQKNGVNISDVGVYSGTQTSILTLTGVTAVDAGTYRCIVTGTCGGENSDPGVLTINAITLITFHPVGPLVKCITESANFDVVASGTNLSYLWSKNGISLSDGGNVSGATTASLSLTNLTLADEGSYSCLVTGAEGTENSIPALLSVNEQTDVTLHPLDGIKCAGDNAVFVIETTGSNLVYQWKKDGIDLANIAGYISGVQTSILTITGVGTIDDGVYHCSIVGDCGEDNSNPATLVVNENTQISSEPTARVKCAGESVTFSITAVGGNLTYQWKKDGGNLSDGGNISGATTKDLTISNLDVSFAGVYSCFISGTCGDENSNSALLTINPDTEITTQPFDGVKCEGDDAFFVVEAQGSNLTYQWRLNGIDLVDGGDISGATTNVLTVISVDAADAGTYQCYVTGTCNNMISDPATLTVNGNVQIVSHPTGDTKCVGESITFSVLATGGNLAYQWKKDGLDLINGGTISGATTKDLTISGVATSNAGVYSCEVSGTCNSVNSGLAILNVLPTTIITIQPLLRTVTEGTAVTFTISASGDNLSYQWQKDGVSLVDGGNISGATTSVLNLSTTTTADAGSYTCIVLGTCGTAVSDPANLTVNVATQILTHPSNLTLCEGASAVFSVTASGSSLAYQWRKDGVTLTEIVGVISGTNTPNLTISSVTTSDAGVYSCVVYGGGGNLTSNPANLIIDKNTTIINEPIPSSNCTGDNVYFSVVADGENLSYQWEKDGVPMVDGGNVSGVLTSVLSISNVTTVDAGIYKCVVTGTCGSVSTTPTSLIVNVYPDAPGAITGANQICQGQTNVVYEVPVINNAQSYEWTLPYGAIILSGTGTRYIVVNFAQDALGGNFSVHGTNGCGDGPESVLVPVTVNPLPVSNAGMDQMVCADTTSLDANPTAFGTWSLVSGPASISNQTQYNTFVQNLGQGDNVFVWTVTENGCTTRDTVVIKNNSLSIYAGSDQTICSRSTMLAAALPTVGQGSWTIVSGSGVFNNVSDPNATVTNLGYGTNIFRWAVNNSGCVSYDTIIIRNDLPTSANAGKDTILLSDTYQLEGNDPAIGNGFWTLISGSANIVTPSLFNSQVTNLGIGENIFMWTIANNLCTDEDEVSVVNYTPTVTYAGPDQVICSDNTMLAGTQPNYGNGQWTVVAGAGFFVNPNKFDTEVINIGKGTNIYRWTIFEYETTFDDVEITNNSPTNANAGVDGQVCINSTFLAGNDAVIGTGLWTIVGGAAVIEDNTQYNTTVTNLSFGSNTFRWTLTNAGCTTFDEVIIMNDSPTGANAGPDQTICVDSVNLYPNTPSIGTGEWSVIGGSALFVGNKAYSVAIDTNMFKWTITNKGCSNSDTVVIVSNKPTTAYTGFDKSICVDSITLPGNIPTRGTGNWTILSGSATIQDATNPNSKATNLALGLNKFRWTITYNGCVSTSEVDINYDLIKASAGADQIICDTRTILEANNATPGTGLWTIVGGSGAATFINNDQPTTEVTNLDRGNNILRWTIVNKSCVSNDDVTITNNNPSTAYAGPDVTVCGSDAALDANPPFVGTGTWTVLSGSATIVDPNLYNSQITDLSLGQNTLRWTIINQNCYSTDEVVVSNNQPINVSAGMNQILCSDSTQLYSSEPLNGYGRWSIAQGSATFADNATYNTMVYNLQKGENLLRWTVYSQGCSYSDTVKVTNNLPSQPSAGPDQDICGDQLAMAANIPFIGTGQWSIVSGSAVFDDLSAPSANVSDIGHGTNTLRWTISNNDCDLFNDVVITNSLPTLAYAGEDRTVCNITANLLATPPTTGTGYWTVVSGFGVLTDPNQHDTQITSLGFGANTLRWITESGRCRTTDDVIITNNLAGVYAGPDQTVYYDNTLLVGNNPSSGTGEWKLLAGIGAITEPSNHETQVTALGGGANTFSWTIDNDGCIASDDVIITYYVLPVADFVPNPASGCPPLTVSFVNNSIGGFPYSWDFGDGSTSTDPNTEHTYTIPGNYKVKLTATGPDGILVHKDTIIRVNEQPVADFDVTPTTVYLPDDPIRCFNLSTNTDSVLWEFGDGSTSTEINPGYVYTQEGIFDITLHVWSGYQCYDSITIYQAVVVERSGIIICPNAFTPNLNGPTGGEYNENDYSNDVFHCFGEGLEEYNLEIFNRWGILVFESKDINVGWDGYYKGKLMDEGVFVFRVHGRFNNGKKFANIGNLILLH